MPAIRPFRAKYETPPPKADVLWLETKHFLAPFRETVLLAWPKDKGFTFRTGRHDGRQYVLSDDTVPRKQPVFFAWLS